MSMSMTKGEMLFEIHEKASTQTIKEFSPAGVRMELNAQGTVSGKHNGAHMETINILQKPDGTNEWQGKGIEMTTEGDMIMITAKGTGKSQGMTGTFQGEATFMTGSKKLEWMNTAKGWIEGTNDISKNEAHIKVYAMK